MAFDLNDYVDVKERVREFYERHPEGRIVSAAPEVRVVGDRYFIEVTTSVYRSADDTIPCVGSAWEPFPGKTPYTRDSEMMNAETSAIGRALAAAGIAVSKSMASANEVRNRRNGNDAVVQPGRKEPAAVAKRRAQIVAKLNALPDDVRSAVKREFVTVFDAPPADLDASRIDEALAWVDRDHSVDSVADTPDLTSPVAAPQGPVTSSDPEPVV